MRIINFSAGQSSALMTILEYNPKTDIVIFCDTGREHPKTYKFLNDFEAYENIPITRITFDGYAGDAFDRLYTKKKTVPNRQFRTCTVELKIRTATRYCRKDLKLKKFDWLIGFRADEKHRVDKYECQQYKNPCFPLYNRNIKLQDVYNYWQAKPYRLEIPRILGNCDLCFLKGKDNIIKILKHYPQLAQRWIDIEERNKKSFIKGITYKQLLQIAQQSIELFPLDDLQAAYSCACYTV